MDLLVASSHFKKLKQGQGLIVRQSPSMDPKDTAYSPMKMEDPNYITMDEAQHSHFLYNKARLGIGVVFFYYFNRDVFILFRFLIHELIGSS